MLGSLLLRNTYGKTVFDRRKSMIWWLIGLGLLIILMSAFYPIVKENAASFTQMLDAYPKDMLAVFGMSSLDDITSPDGYLQVELFSFMMPLIFMIYAIGTGANLIAGEEENKTIDLLLAHPVSRTQVLLEKVVGMLSLIGFLGLFSFVCLWIGALLFDMDIQPIKLLAVMTQTVLMATVFGMIAFTIGALTGRKSVSIGISAAIAIVAYFANALAPSIDWLAPIQKLSPFYYAYDNKPLVNGFDVLSLVVMSVVVLVLVAVAQQAFNKRDIAV